MPALLYLLAWLRARRDTEALEVPEGEVGASRSRPLAARPHAATSASTIGRSDERPDPSQSPVRHSSDTLERASSGNGLLLAGLLVHAAAVAVGMSGLAVGIVRSTAAEGTTLHYGFAPALSLTLWFGVAVLWAEGLHLRVESLQRVVLPVAALAAVLPLFFPGNPVGQLASLPLFIPHLLVGTLAYGLLLLAALHAGLMRVAERALHAPGQASASALVGWVGRLPPLLVLERILFRFIGMGFLMLSLTAVSGIMFSEQVFGQPLRFDHKTVFTLIAWLMFGVLLVGRSRWGWRGRTALRWTLSGFVVLMLAYVGSHFVREVILQRV